MEPIKESEYQGVRFELFSSVGGGYWCLVHFKNRVPGTQEYQDHESAINAAEDMIRGYESALYDARNFLNRNFQGLLSDMMEIM